MNALQCALVNAGLAEEPQYRKPKLRKFKCKKCGSEMTPHPNTNIMTCDNPQCDNYFIFTKKGANER